MLFIPGGLVGSMGFNFAILRCCQIGDHPQEDLDKFSCRQDMKI
jgi:hypothetical protein